jgi:non-heme chloroperoxidase
MSTDKPASATLITEHEAGQMGRAKAPGRTPVVFVHGLGLLPSSWDRWAELFETAGYVALTPGWPGDPETTAQASRSARSPTTLPRSSAP